MSLILLLVASILALLRPSWMVLRIWFLWRFMLPQKAGKEMAVCRPILERWLG